MNTLPKSRNYYEKYMKYKKKYIDYKNNLLALSRENSALIGGGELANIQILKSDNSTVMTDDDFKLMISKLNGCYIVIKDIRTNTIKYKIIEKAGSGTTGTVYKIEQIEPLLPQGSNNSFAIKLTTHDPKVGDEPENRNEGATIDGLPVEDRVKAIYQGLTGSIDFAIYKYLGEDLIKFLKKKYMPLEIQLSLIRQLHKQLCALNIANHLHNDVKMENIVVRSTDTSGNLELSLIDYGVYKPDHSNIGTWQSMCIRGCARFLLDSEHVKISLDQSLIQLVERLLGKATSTDYVGFFNVIICLLNYDFCAFTMYIDILKIDGKYTIDNLLNVLCFLCYVSNSADPVCTQFLIHPSCISKVKKIREKLEAHLTDHDNRKLFINFVPDRDIHVHLQRRILFLSYLYHLITTHATTRYAKFVNITKLPKLLWDLSCCLDLQFNLEQFNANFDTIFNDQLLVPLPPPAPQPLAPSPLLPPTISPLPSPSPSQQQQTPSQAQQQQTPTPSQAQSTPSQAQSTPSQAQPTLSQTQPTPSQAQPTPSDAEHKSRSTALDVFYQCVLLMIEFKFGTRTPTLAEVKNIYAYIEPTFIGRVNITRENMSYPELFGKLLNNPTVREILRKYVRASTIDVRNSFYKQLKEHCYEILRQSLNEENAFTVKVFVGYDFHKMRDYVLNIIPLCTPSLIFCCQL